MAVAFEAWVQQWSTYIMVVLTLIPTLLVHGVHRAGFFWWLATAWLWVSLALTLNGLMSMDIFFVILLATCISHCFYFGTNTKDMRF